MSHLGIETVKRALVGAWSRASSSLWSKENPAAGQCGVSALIANDLLGGEILKTPFGDTWHFYNRIDGVRIDFTESQFEAPIDYDDVFSDREEAFRDTSEAQYGYLRKAVTDRL